MYTHSPPSENEERAGFRTGSGQSGVVASRRCRDSPYALVFIINIIPIITINRIAISTILIIITIICFIVIRGCRPASARRSPRMSVAEVPRFPLMNFRQNITNIVNYKMLQSRMCFPLVNFHGEMWAKYDKLWASYGKMWATCDKMWQHVTKYFKCGKTHL